MHILSRIVNVSFVSLLALCSTHCGSSQALEPPDSSIQFDSARLQAVDATITSAILQTFSKDPEQQEKEIRKQLKYTVGQINGVGGAPQLKSLVVDIKGFAEVAESEGLLNVEYQASFLLSWPRAVVLPEQYTFYLPLGAERSFIDQFLNDGGDTKRCLHSTAHGVDSGNAWYYYRPFKETCEIGKAQVAGVIPITAQFALSAENTIGKYPEYAKIWEDGRLVVTLVFGKDKAESLDIQDAGVKAYRNTYMSLIKTFGNPLGSNLPLNIEAPDATQKSVLMTFNTPRGFLDVNLELIDHLDSDKDFAERYNARMAISDFVQYSGHSGLGSNIGQLMKMGTFVKGQYQLFRLNGCDSFAYYTDEIRMAHWAVNPEEGPDTYIDIITNSQPSLFSSGPREAITIINALIAQKYTYRDLLFRMEPSQQNAVTGEQDNAAWVPLP